MSPQWEIQHLFLEWNFKNKILFFTDINSFFEVIINNKNPLVYIPLGIEGFTDGIFQHFKHKFLSFIYSLFSFLLLSKKYFFA